MPTARYFWQLLMSRFSARLFWWTLLILSAIAIGISLAIALPPPPDF